MALIRDFDGEFKFFITIAFNEVKTNSEKVQFESKMRAERASCKALDSRAQL